MSKPYRSLTEVLDGDEYLVVGANHKGAQTVRPWCGRSASQPARCWSCVRCVCGVCARACVTV